MVMSCDRKLLTYPLSVLKLASSSSEVVLDHQDVELEVLPRPLRDQRGTDPVINTSINGFHSRWLG